MKRLISCEGGIGKNIALTSAIRSLKKQFPNDEINIITAYPYVYYNNPHINKIYEFGKVEYFYDDVVKTMDIVHTENPYLHSDYILKKSNLIDVYCKIFGVKSDNHQPELYFNSAEINAVKDALQPYMDKPILAVQTNGGVGNDWKWDRDMPKEIINPLLSNYIKTHNILHYRAPEQPPLTGDNIMHTADMTVRNAMVALKFAHKIITIDSWVMHAAAALNKKATVLWIASDPKLLGYEYQNNIIADMPDNKSSRINSVYWPYDIQANPQSCPYLERQRIFDTNKIK